MVATSLPGATGTVRAMPDAVAPSVSGSTIGPDGKANAVYVAPATPEPVTSSPLSPLTVPIPASFTTNAASLSADAMYTAQALSQDPGVYETMIADAQVKYKPSNATVPEPAANNIFAKMLAEEQSHAAPVAQKMQVNAAPAP